MYAHIDTQIADDRRRQLERQAEHHRLVSELKRSRHRDGK